MASENISFPTPSSTVHSKRLRRNLVPAAVTPDAIRSKAKRKRQKIFNEMKDNELASHEATIERKNREIVKLQRQLASAENLINIIMRLGDGVDERPVGEVVSSAPAVMSNAPLASTLSDPDFLKELQSRVSNFRE